jgi:ribose 5-phosphate isomerase B
VFDVPWGGARLSISGLRTGIGKEVTGEMASIAIGSDNARFELKDVLARHLRDGGYEVKDFGTDPDDPADYPDVAVEVAEAVARGEHERAILCCGTGLGMPITANKVPGVRAA